VVCRQLGYLDAVPIPRYINYDQGTGPVWLEDVQCLGTEQDILTCTHRGIGLTNNCYSEDASVECLGTIWYNIN